MWTWIGVYPAQREPLGRLRHTLYRQWGTWFKNMHVFTSSLIGQIEIICFLICYLEKDTPSLLRYAGPKRIAWDESGENIREVPTQSCSEMSGSCSAWGWMESRKRKLKESPNICCKGYWWHNLQNVCVICSWDNGTVSKSGFDFILWLQGVRSLLQRYTDRGEHHVCNWLSKDPATYKCVYNCV